ncbi:sugar ABC transporter substrate-binding protein [Rubellimicrobium rubrum]|uniref:Sugar ABC transporter substrate-binding protein n=1 Tax=Rubellimicrobium rubrum TaxID=2585369 RepID=A0A5C4N481_9RHOB|nr:sugar ABC transporter substrate-binding protein [Rubellimicrobium rubrum]TNC52341.1 sugar ABC transporter substrate-binding protein [Rubellimicrobium rubrum]
MTIKAMLAGSAVILATPALAQEQVTLDLWTIDDPGEYHYVMAEEYMAANPNVTINVRTVQFEDMVNDLARSIATGDAPDITYIDNPEVALFASRGMLLDLTPYIEASEVVKVEDIYPGPLASVTYEGGIYGLPRGANTIALYYNADKFREAGLNPDDPPATWDELYETAKALTDPESNVYGLAFSAVGTEEGTFQFLPWLQMTGGDYNNINTEGAARALNLWKQFIDEGIASPDTLIRSQWDSTGTFNAGNAAMAISGPWEIPRMSEEAQFEWRVALLPVPEDGAERASALGEGDNVILANTDTPDEAFAFLEFLYGDMDRVWNDFGYLPASAVEVTDPKYPEAYAVFEESMKYARNRGPESDWPQVSGAIQTAIQSTLTGQATAEEALAEAQAEIDDVLGN